VGDATENADDLAPHAPSSEFKFTQNHSLLKTSSQMVPLSAERNSSSRRVAGLAAIVSRAGWLSNMNVEL
jgi:hypothetical protein